jgi:hypothetical protein
MKLFLDRKNVRLILLRWIKIENGHGFSREETDRAGTKKCETSSEIITVQI